MQMTNAVQTTDHPGKRVVAIMEHRGTRVAQLRQFMRPFFTWGPPRRGYLVIGSEEPHYRGYEKWSWRAALIQNSLSQVEYCRSILTQRCYGLCWITQKIQFRAK
jgi:hypothetical protein